MNIKTNLLKSAIDAVIDSFDFEKFKKENGVDGFDYVDKEYVYEYSYEDILKRSMQDFKGQDIDDIPKVFILNKIKSRIEDVILYGVNDIGVPSLSQLNLEQQRQIVDLYQIINSIKAEESHDDNFRAFIDSMDIDFNYLLQNIGDVITKS